MIPLIQNASEFSERVAIKSDNISYSYNDLLNNSERISLGLLAGRKDLKEDRVVFIVPPGFSYVSTQWGIWRAGGIAVPLCTSHPLSSIEYVLEDTQPSVFIFSKEYENFIEPLIKKFPIKFIRNDKFDTPAGTMPNIDLSRRAMILYTSGTTGLPKGVVSTHQNIEAQITSLTTAWEWKKSDHILNVLPLHHVHGIINVLSCALRAGACCEFLRKFDPEKVFEIFNKKEVNLFMAVPTIYYQLISHWDSQTDAVKKELTATLRDFRLMVSGSAALPISVMQRWKQISGQDLLERYGMTEIGMAISNPYRGKRRPGYVGQALSGVNVRIAEEENQQVNNETSGEIQVSGPNVFLEYWNKPKATLEAFTKDGWFKTGDIAVFNNGSFKILGRNSVDIIKSGGYKISALEIEEVLRVHPGIKDCSVVGIPDVEWGEIVAASLIPEDLRISITELKDWLKTRLPAYKIPRKYLIQKELPRNVMGKVTKNELKKLFLTSSRIKK